MTYERAAEILDPNHREHYDSIDPVNEACEIGRKAILKRIPQLPEFEADGYDNDGELIYDMAYCPECRNPFEYDTSEWGCNFCPNCGQALVWRSDE